MRLILNMAALSFAAIAGVSIAADDPNLVKSGDKTKTEAGTKQPTSNPSTESKTTNSNTKLSDHTRTRTDKPNPGKDNKP
jgi:hypothetical protein